MRIWSQAKDLAAKTPSDRNRYVDFLRAASILVVITGHWLIAGIYYHDGMLNTGDLLEIQPDTQWLTWLFQVMPIFFIVGGYANAVSLESAHRREIGYAGWLVVRLNRLVTPLLVLLLGWALLAAILYFSGVSGDVTRLASRTALIPTWFLAIYIMVVVLAPATWPGDGGDSLRFGRLRQSAHSSISPFSRPIFNGWAGVITSGSGSLFTISDMLGEMAAWVPRRGFWLTQRWACW